MRQIKQIIKSNPQPIGEHYMVQPLPNRYFENLDPFLLLHHHGPHTFQAHNQGLPFGPHPHRGFETLTLIYSGEVEHADSQGFRSVIKEGGIQWMTAGRGIVHSENIPEHMREEGGKLEIIQLWMNLPKSMKMVSPTYQGLQKDEIPVFKSEDGLVHTQVISGELNGVNGTAKSITSLTVLNIDAKAGGQLSLGIPEEEEVLCYVLQGKGNVNGKTFHANELVQFENTGTDVAFSFDQNTRVLLAYGKPFDEPIVAQGPFVMNSTTEILQAMRDYQLGKMGVM
ncbi:pirin family protein [Marinilongibacter aquaticus]|uniref:pirin family protein n=1 Tax=Marinilongibacter aquaticus TaxID=2975157 RepID=UPI0021BDD94A|nr:pirin family protein [Marinilongibacter aquaticus]UBM60396.1 pirin family protein [Marinilongibacter aquaticus]